MFGAAAVLGIGYSFRPVVFPGWSGWFFARLATDVLSRKLAWRLCCILQVSDVLRREHKVLRGEEGQRRLYCLLHLER